MDAPLSRDTQPEAQEAQLRLLREASVGRRCALARSLTGTVVALSRRALARRDPASSDRDVLLEFVSLHYGPELAAGVRARLSRRPA
jgi:hypothetical protein